MLKKYPWIVKLAKNTNGNGQISKEVGQNRENPSKKEAMSPRKAAKSRQMCFGATRVKRSEVFCAVSD